MDKYDKREKLAHHDNQENVSEKYREIKNAFSNSIMSTHD
jgi:hypothetical protein